MITASFKKPSLVTVYPLVGRADGSRIKGKRSVRRLRERGWRFTRRRDRNLCMRGQHNRPCSCTEKGVQEERGILAPHSFFFSFFDGTHGMKKLPGQGLNLHQSSDLSHSRDNARSLIH